MDAIFAFLGQVLAFWAIWKFLDHVATPFILEKWVNLEEESNNSNILPFTKKQKEI